MKKTSKTGSKTKAAPKLEEFTVVAYVTIAVSKRIKATSQKEALKQAENLVMPSLCHQCDSAGADYDDTWELGGIDGEPLNMKIEE